MTCSEINSMPIKEIAAKLGFVPAKERKHEGVFIAHYRGEKHPSLHINYERNIWFDFGSGEGGRVVDLICRAMNCNVKDAIRWVSSCFDGMVTTTMSRSEYAACEKRNNPNIEDVTIEPIHSKALLQYAASRGILPVILCEYCNEVSFYHPGKNKRYFSIGFQSDSGGFEMRNAFSKMALGAKDATTIIGSETECCVFEGFFDFLSFQQQKNLSPSEICHIDPAASVVVLNSVANLKKSLAPLLTYKTVRCFLDNDNAGRSAYKDIMSYRDSRGLSTVDESSLYAGYNDYNEWWTWRAEQMNLTKEISKENDSRIQ